MTTVAIAEGVIEPEVLYALPTFHRVSGQKVGAVRQARRNGLIVRRVGLRSYVLGQDWIDYVKQHGKIVGQDA